MAVLFGIRARAIVLRTASTLAAVLLFFWHPGWMQMMEFALWDRLAHWQSQRLPQAVSPGGDTDTPVLIEIDERSLARYGRWPWPRARTAELVDAILAGKPAVLALAILFPEKSEDDARLRRSLAAGPVVAGQYFSFLDDLPVGPACAAKALPNILGNVDTEIPFYSAKSMQCNVPEIENGLAFSGFLNGVADSEGVTRRAPLMIAYRGQLYPSLALAAVMAARPVRGFAIGPVRLGGELPMRLNSASFALDPAAGLWPRFAPAGSLRKLSAADVLERKVPASQWENRLVFAGPTARGTTAALRTPISPDYSGLEFHASVAGNLLHGNAFRPAGSWRGWELLGILIAGLLSAAFLFSRPPRVAIAYLIAGSLAAWLTGTLAMAISGAFLSPLLLLLAMGGNFLLAASLWWKSENGKRERTAEELATYRRFLLASLSSLSALAGADSEGHLVRVQQAARALCQALRKSRRYRNILDADTVELFVAAAPIHDIGKLGLPDEILGKEDPLTVAEKEAIRHHVRYGLEVLEKASAESGLAPGPFWEMCRALVYCHHERWDGSGYPEGLKGDAIPWPARVLAVLDVYDAMVSKRVYKQSRPHAQVMSEIVLNRGRLFEPDVVDAFVACQREVQRIYGEASAREEKSNAAGSV